MPIFSKLFEMLPDAEHLLSLEPEELAGPLLVSLEGSDRINPEIIISYNDMAREINISERKIPNLNYPSGCHQEILFALMEAWQHLVCEGFVAPRPIRLSDSPTIDKRNIYFITRRGKKIETLENYEDYRKADLLRKHQLHPILAEKVWFIFTQGSYGTAVLEAFRQVEVAVRRAGGYEENDRGTDLMRRAFNIDNGNLTDKSRLTAVRQAMSDLFAGAIGLYKNPSSHHDVKFTPETAAETIIIASHLLRIVDSCEQLNPNSST